MGGGGISGITMTPSNNIYVGGGGGVSEITVFGYDGKEILNKEWSGDEMTTGFPSIISDESENIYTAGSNSLLKKPLLIKFDKDLNELWREELPEDGLNVDALSIDNSENIIAGMRNGDILKFSPEGKELWHHNISTEDAEGQINALAVDSEGNIYAGGYTWDDLFETNAGETDAFLVKIAPDKTHIWEKQWGVEKQDRVNDLIIDDVNNIYVAGGSSGETEILLKFSSDGKKIWGNEGSAVNYNALALDEEDNLYVGIGFRKNLVEKYNSDGEKIWNSNDEGEWEWSVSGIALDSYGNLYICGGKNSNYGSFKFFVYIPVSHLNSHIS